MSPLPQKLSELQDFSRDKSSQNLRLANFSNLKITFSFQDFDPPGITNLSQTPGLRGLKHGDGMGLDCGVGWFTDNLLCFSFFSKRAQRELTFLFSILLFPGSFSLEGMVMAAFKPTLSSIVQLSPFLLLQVLV